MNSKTITAGFAIFCMFFGAGNIVLPLYLVQSWPGDIYFSFLGFCLTGVLVPLLGLIAAVFTGEINKYFIPLGAAFGLIMQIILICIEGPFGVLPRCLIVSGGAFMQEFPKFNIEIFYIICSVFLFFLAIKERLMVSIVGKFFTPIMLIFLFVLFFLSENKNLDIYEHGHQMDAFLDGIYKGYLTYDLPAAIYFTAIAMHYFKGFENNKDNSDFIKQGLIASLIAIALLIVVYAAFINIGMANYSIIKDISPEQILPAIIKGSLGNYTSFVFTIFILLACLTTAVAAITVWSDFIEDRLFKNKTVPRTVVLFISLVISFFVAELKFKGLISLLQPILQIIYPILIILTIYNIYLYYKNKKRSADV